MTARHSPCIALAFALLSAIPVTATARPVAAEDLFKLVFLETPRISPDGKHVAVIRRTINGPANAYETTVLLVDLASPRVADLTRGTQDSDPVWSPNSKGIYFVRPDAAKRPQIFRHDLGKPQNLRITNIAAGATAPVPSHSGAAIAFSVLEVDSPHAARIDFSKAGFTPTKAQQRSDIRTIDNTQFELNGAGYIYDNRTHIWVAGADGSHPRQITSGRFSDTLDGWSHDDSRLVFSSTRFDPIDSGPVDIYSVPTRGGDADKMLSD
ncbi:MAG: hypothetical protein M3N13_00730, partial [Candidatus Eremiobacteraeota bacterium]|nr:hypothetical protein [Candidatus Eremiobacteraeota bacterium]